MHSSLVPLPYFICILYLWLWNLPNQFKSVERLGCLVFAPKGLNLPIMTECKVSQTRCAASSLWTQINPPMLMCSLTEFPAVFVRLSSVWAEAAVNVSLTSLRKRNIALNMGMCSCNVLGATWQHSWDCAFRAGLVSVLTEKRGCRQVIFF